MLNYTMSKKPVNQAFFEDLLNKATKSDRKILNYLFKFCLHQKYVYACNATIAHALGISARTVGRCFAKFKEFFLREDRYRFVDGRRMQCASRTRLRSWVLNLDVLKALAWVIPAIRSFPRILMDNLLPKYEDLFTPTFFTVSTLLSVILSNQNKNDSFLKESSSNKSSAYERFISKKISRGSAEGGIENSIPVTNPAKEEKKRMDVVKFDLVQQMEWDKYPEQIQKTAEQRLTMIKQKQKIKNEALYILKIAEQLTTDLQKKQTKTATKSQPEQRQRLTPSIEQQARQKAQDYTLAEIDAKIAELQRIITQVDKRDERYVQTFVNNLASFEQARILRLLTEEPQEPAAQPKLQLTRDQLDTALHLVKLMPAQAKEEALIAKAQGHPMTKNNPVLDYILEQYLKSKKAQGDTKDVDERKSRDTYPSGAYRIT